MKSIEWYILCIKKKVTKKVYNNIMNSIKVQYKVDTIFMNSENSKASKSYRVSINLADKINFRRKEKYSAWSNLSMYCTWKNIKKSYKNNKISNKLKYQLQHGMLNLICLMDHILYQIFNIILNISLKKAGRKDWWSFRKNICK